MFNYKEAAHKLSWDVVMGAYAGEYFNQISVEQYPHPLDTLSNMLSLLGQGYYDPNHDEQEINCT